MELDICFDVQTFLERTCRTCSRYFSDDLNSEGMQFYKIFDEIRNKEQPSEDDNEIFEELQIWKLNIRPKDGLPQKICSDCYERLLGVKAFREECLDTQTVLESYFKEFNHLNENKNPGRISPKDLDLVKSETHAKSPILPAASPSNGSPKLINCGSSKYIDFNDDFYAESFMGSPPPLFEEIKTDPIDMCTLESIKSEAEVQPDGSPKVQNMKHEDDIIYNKLPKTAEKKMKVQHFTSSDDESSTPTSDEDDDDDDDDLSIATENDDENMRKRSNIRISLQCRICFAAFSRRFMLKDHLQRVHPQEKPFVCHICGKAFKTKFMLKQHEVQHNRPDTIKCDLCGKYFRSQLHLQRHAKNFHLTSTYTCHICHEKFENYTQIRFQYHVRQHGEKRFQCDFCGKSFHQKIHLINHERTHSKEQPFSCDICGKAYRQQTACQEHMLTHIDPTPFKCKVCQKGFTQRSSLRLHYRTHEKLPELKQQKSIFQCKFCGQSFKQQFQYEMHQLSHENRKFFLCNHCNAEFKEESYLECHIQSMHGIKRKCAYCGEVCQNDLALKCHLKTHAKQLNNYKGERETLY